MAPVVPSEGQQKVPAPQAPPPRVLVVDDEPNLVELIDEVVGRGMGCCIVSAASIEHARKILATQPVELLVTDVHLPDGDGTSLLPDLRQHHPHATAIVITGAPSMDGVITAMRSGALDFVPKPFTHSQLCDRVKMALERQAKSAKDGLRFRKLRQAVKRLNESRRVISKKVDLLCNDLVTAYGELSRQLDGVRTQEGFRKYVATAKDLEQLLCHAMDWMLRQMGYANVGVYLAADDGEFQLGAYMKYTVPGEPMLVDALKREVLPLAVRDSLVHLPAAGLADKLTPQEMHYLKGQDVLAVNCTYLGESLAALAFFRDGKTPFGEADEALLKAISPIFAVALASVVRDADVGDAVDGDGEGGAGAGEDNPFYDGVDEPGEEGGGGGLADRDDNKKPRNKKRRGNSDADWWKRGEPPPF